VIRLQSPEPTVWARTLDALIASRLIKPALTVRCKQCHAQLARAGVTPLGPLFTSSWTVEVPTPFEVFVDGQRLSRRAAIRHHANTTEVAGQSGPAISDTEIHGTIALLALPPEMPQDYPPLMVSCARHGDALVGRSEVLADLRAGSRVLYVLVSLPRLEYDVGELRAVDGAPAEQTSLSTETRRWGCPSAAESE
jgi:hypothetical protein